MSNVDAWRASLLPPNATAFETAEEKTDAARYPLDTDSIRRVKDANETPADILPVLAWERSVDVWWPGQSETSQRFITDKSFELHKQKGTRTGLKRHIELTGAKVLRIDAPPLMAFPGREWTDEERLAWLARFPQIRTFKYRNSGQVAGAMYASDDLWMNEKAPLIFADEPESRFAKFAVTVNGFEYHGYHSFLWDRGTETPLTTWDRVVTEEDKTINIYDWIVLPGTINCRWFADQIPVGGVPDHFEESGFFCTDDPLADRTVSVFRDTEDYQDNNDVRHQRL